MFKKQMLLTSLPLLAIGALCAVHITWMRPADLEHYRSLTEARELAYSPTNQQRQKVQKEIWFSKDPHTRLHYKLCSAGSTLTLTPVASHFEIVESLQGVLCWMQDQLEGGCDGKAPSQQARLIEAESGVYRHSALEFCAKSAHLSLFNLSGHTLPQTPPPKSQALLTGKARDITFALKSKAPQCRADQFQATIVKESPWTPF